MPSCPECQKEIHYLRHYAHTVVNTLFIVSDGVPTYGMTQLPEIEEDEGVYTCPVCFKDVASTEAHAKAILQKIHIKEVNL